jgi:uncharacterized membrane protein ArfB
LPRGQVKGLDMDFVVQWLWYLAAFAAGSLVAWLIAVVVIRRTTDERTVAVAKDDESAA